LNDIPVIRLLIDKGAAVDTRGIMGDTPLLVAVIENHYNSAALLLERGASINVSPNNSPENTPIQLAVRIESKELISLLMRNGATSEGLDFSLLENAEEIESFVNEEKWKEDEWDPELISQRQSWERKEDAKEVEYPECRPVDLRKRYCNTEFIKEMEAKEKKRLKS
jgi:hypothetical protein